MRVTGTSESSGLRVIEAIERMEHPFVFGIQFHPEVALCMRLDGKANAGNYMTEEQGLAFFKALVEKVRSAK